jgi:GNAT superfamily N-acetyltransferase
VIVEPAGRDEFLALMQETYGHAMSPDEFDWWFDRNPPRILTAAREDGTALGVLAMSLFRMDDGPAAYALHAVTSPAARGKGVFSKLELHNEVEAAEAGAAVALGFTNPQAGPILVGKLGWEDVTRLRIWVRPKRLRPRREGRLRVHESARFGEREERCYRDEARRWGRHIVRDAGYLNWRYVDSPREYAVYSTDGGWAVATHAEWQGFSCAVVADAVGRGKTRLIHRCAAAADADIAVAMVNPGEERAYLAAGFVPTPRTIRFIGKRLKQEAALPKERRAWRFSLGDLDFF